MPVERQTEYETIYILRPTADDEEKKKVRERIDNIISTDGGHHISFDDWGTRRLAYRIRDNVDTRYHEQGVYQYLRFLAPTQTTAEIERNLNIVESVLKFQTVKVEDGLIPADRLSRVDEADEEE